MIRHWAALKAQWGLEDKYQIPFSVSNPGNSAVIYMEFRAEKFAERKHAAVVNQDGTIGQLRKYTGEPYIAHPRAVRDLVREYSKHTMFMLAAALLHDTLEDTDTNLHELVGEFGLEVAMLVQELTDRYTDPLEWGNRAERKTLERNRMLYMSQKAKTIKLADLIHNSNSILEFDPKFAPVYLEEKRLSLGVLIEGDANLWKMAHDIVTTGKPWVPPAPKYTHQNKDRP